MTDTLIPAKTRVRGGDRPASGLRTQLFIDGAFRDAIGGGRYVTENPATGRRSPRSPRAAPPTSTRRWPRLGRHSTTAAGPG